MSSTIIIKNSATSGSVPSSLVQGEMAINVTNGRLFYGSGSGNEVKEFTTSAVSASYALSSSYSLTASYALNAGASSIITSSLYSFTQSSPATTWSINHNLNEVYPIVNVYSGSFAIIPSQIKSINSDNLEIYFTIPTTGYATIVGKNLLVSGSAVSASYAATASYLEGFVTSASYAATASSADSFVVRNSLTASGLNYPTADNGEFSFIQTDGNGNLSLQYVNTIYETIYNGEATTILKGTPVYVSGSQGANSIVYIADASVSSKMPVIYIAADNIASGNTGRGIALGLITGVDTTGYPAGTEIYVAAGGGWTATRPTGSSIIQILGIVTKESAGGQGLVLNPGPANLPNITSGSVWIGNANSIPIIVPTSSLLVNTASFASTASYLNPLRQDVIITGSIYFESGSYIFINNQDTTIRSGVNGTVSGDLLLTNYDGAQYIRTNDNGTSINNLTVDTVLTANNMTGSLFGTASYARNALSASFTSTASYVLNAVSSSFSTTSSFAFTASYVLNAVSASFTSTASLAFRASGSLTGSLLGTASYASQALSASYASNVLATKSGRILNSSFTGNPRKATVTFSTAFVDNNYSVVVTGEDARTWTIESKVSGSFVVSANSNTGLAGTTYWIATAHGEN